MTDWILFTDLDGTLLDRCTYSWAAARDALRELQERDIPIVFCSSKTRSEQYFYQQQMGLIQPMIVENGSAIIIPEGYFDPQPVVGRQLADGSVAIETGSDARSIRAKLNRIRSDFDLPFCGYADMSNAQLESATGLCGIEATRARQREYSETIQVDFNAAQRLIFENALAAERLRCVSGGHLLTVTSVDSSKRIAAARLIDLFRRRIGSVKTIGIGDSPNDRGLLKVMDVACQVARPDGTWHEMRIPGVRRYGIGPDGWSQAVADLAFSPAR